MQDAGLLQLECPEIICGARSDFLRNTFQSIIRCQNAGRLCQLQLQTLITCKFRAIREIVWPVGHPEISYVIGFSPSLKCQTAA